MVTEAKRIWYQANKGRVKAQVMRNRFRRVYRITVETARILSVMQGHKCAICGLNAGDNLHGKLYPDHNHVTGLLRGMLCHQCNVGLGAFKDDPVRLKRALAYLILAERGEP